MEEKSEDIILETICRSEQGERETPQESGEALEAGLPSWSQPDAEPQGTQWNKAQPVS